MDPSHRGMDSEAPKDPGALKKNASITENEILGHHNVYVGFQVPGQSRRQGSSHGHHSRGQRASQHRRNKRNLKTSNDEGRPVTPPAQRVQFILGEDQEDSGHEPHPVFSEMEELFMDEDGEVEWKETARWVKFEEDVEEGGNRWSKPYVATLTLHSLFELRSMILNGTVCLDMVASNLDDITDLALDAMVNANLLPADMKFAVKDTVLKRHRHQYEGQHKDRASSTSAMSKLPLIRSLADIGRNHSTSKSMTRVKEFFGSSSDLRGVESHGELKAVASADAHGFLAVPAPHARDGAHLEADESSASVAKPTSGSLGSFLAVPSQRGTSAMQGHHNTGLDSTADINRQKSSDEINANDSSAGISAKMNAHFMKKLPKGAEASNILVGELNVLEKPISAFIRLNEAVLLGDLTEVPVPTRFLFLLLGPPGENNCNLLRFHEIGRAVATVMADEVFHEIAYKARKREHLLAGLDEFLDSVTVLPPGEWDPSIRIEPPQQVPSQEGRRNPKKAEQAVDEEEEETKMRAESGLVRTGRLFGGLMNDIRRKKPFYLSDFIDGFSVQCVASIVFIYFACLTPIITFGGLLGDATENRIAAIESLLSGLIVGVIYGLFSGQPLTIMGSTGPILVFETIVFDTCKKLGWAYLSFRLWIGLWCGLFLFLFVAFDASALVCFITRFTEENFATLIAVIFIIKAFEKVAHIGDDYPIHPSACFCEPKNLTLKELYGTSTDFVGFNETKRHVFPCEFDADNMTIEGKQSVGCHYVPNAFLMSLLLFGGTFLIAFHLKNFRVASFFPAKVRATISDFAVLIAILSMTATDHFSGVDTPKLKVPETLRPTWSGRGWLIYPFEGNPVWSPIAAILPALLATILIFMDQQITAVIINRKEFKLLKGGGYHLDLLIVTILIVVCSIFGLPWFVAATVISINHVKSLTRETETAAPGEKPQFLGIREQRVTHVVIFILIGLSTLMVKVLSFVPMPVLYGVFLYMGFASLKGLQFFDRILLFFMPKKYQPDVPYLRRVPLARVHLFTVIQLACFAGLWIIKDVKDTSILFPIMLVVMIGVRKLLDFVFTKSELKILDDILPEFSRHEKIKEEEEEEQEERDQAAYKESLMARKHSIRYTDSAIELPLANGNVMKIPMVDSDINISEEVNKSGVWKSLEGSTTIQPSDNKQTSNNSNGKNRHKDRGKRSMTIPEEGEDEDMGIQIKIDKPRPDSGTSEERKRLVGHKDDETEV